MLTLSLLIPPQHTHTLRIVHTIEWIFAAAATEASIGLLPKLDMDFVNDVVAMLDDDVPEIRRNVIAKGVAKLSEKLSSEQFREGVLTPLRKCEQDKQWLVRAAYVEQLPAIAKKLVRASLVLIVGWRWLTADLEE